MTDDELCLLVRSVAKEVDKGFPTSMVEAVRPLREAGISPGMKEGINEQANRRDTLEWYAGQLLDIVEKRSWFAVNSWLNCIDKFAPLVPSGPEKDLVSLQEKIDSLTKALESCQCDLGALAAAASALLADAKSLGYQQWRVSSKAIKALEELVKV